MKRLMGSILAIFALATTVQATNTPVYQGIMNGTEGSAQSNAGASTQTYTMDMNGNTGQGGDIIGMQINYASATIPAVTFKDGAVSTFTITVVSTAPTVAVADQDTLTVANNSALVPIASTASITVSSNTAPGLGLPNGLIGSTITIGVALPTGGAVANTSFTFVGGTDYAIGASSNATAINLAASINFKMNQALASYKGYTSNSIAGLIASVGSTGGAVITLTANNPGASGNAWTITTSTTAALPVATWYGGQDNSSFSYYFPIRGSTITFTQGQQWKADPTYSSNTAVNIANAWNAAGGYGVTAATTSSTVVTFTANNPGAFANSDSLSANTSALTASNNPISGQNAGSIQIGNYILTTGIAWAPPLVSSTTANLATAMATAITNSSNTLGFVASAVSNVVYATATFVGPGSIIASSTQTVLTISPYTSSSTLTGIAVGTSWGGVASNYVIGPTITIPNHGLTTALGVLYTTGTATAISGLTWGTTYYPIIIDANNFKLASSAANALAGTAITLASSATKTTADSFTLSPLPVTGVGLFTLQASNDGVNFAQVTSIENGVSITPVSVTTPWALGSTDWAIGFWPWRFLQIKYSAPTTGGLKYSVYVYQKNGAT